VQISKDLSASKLGQVSETTMAEIAAAVAAVVEYQQP
jgi:hypothetical protein